MKNKYVITVVSLLVASLFIGTTMTSAIAASTNSDSQTSATSTGCSLCAGGSDSVNGQPIGGDFDCGKYMFNTAVNIGISVLATVITTIGNIIQNTDWTAVAKLLLKGYTLLGALVKIVGEWIQDHPGLIQTIENIVWNYIIVPFGNILTDPDVWQFFHDTAIAVGTAILSAVIVALPNIILFVIWGIGQLIDLAGNIRDRLIAICEYLGNCPSDQLPQQLVLQDLSAVSELAIQNAMQAIAPSTQKFSAVSPQSTSAILKTISTGSTVKTSTLGK